MRVLFVDETQIDVATMKNTYDGISTDGRLGVLELLLDAADDRLAVGANEASEDKLRVNRVSPDDLSSMLKTLSLKYL